MSCHASRHATATESLVAVAPQGNPTRWIRKSSPYGMFSDSPDDAKQDRLLRDPLVVEQPHGRVDSQTVPYARMRDCRALGSLRGLGPSSIRHQHNADGRGTSSPPCSPRFRMGRGTLDWGHAGGACDGAAGFRHRLGRFEGPRKEKYSYGTHTRGAEGRI